jgi:hypothetical protein
VRFAVSVSWLRLTCAQMLCNMSVVIVHSIVTWFGNWREFLPAARLLFTI